MTLAEKLKPYVSQIIASAAKGNGKAQMVISLYNMHRACPSDPGAPALCEMMFRDWLNAHGLVQ